MAANFQIRSMSESDVEAVHQIDRLGYRVSWGTHHFFHSLYTLKHVCLVATFRGHVIGYCVCLVRKKQIVLERISVHPKVRRKGIARNLVAELRNQLSKQQITRIVCLVRERNLTGQLFMRAMSFTAEEILKDHFAVGEDGYVFEYRSVRPPLRNRLSRFYPPPVA